MRKLIFSSVILLLPFLAISQINLELDSVFVSQGAVDAEMTGYNNFTNALPQKKTFKWTRNVINITQGWTSYICDDVLCYGPATGEAELELGANQSSILDVHVDPNGVIEGMALIEMKIELADDPNTNITGVYMFNSTLTSNDELDYTEFKIYPNPSAGLFTIDQPSERFGSLEIYSCTGVLLSSFFNGQDNWLEISNLQSGTYVCILKNQEGKTVGTQLVTKL